MPKKGQQNFLFKTNIKVWQMFLRQFSRAFQNINFRSVALVTKKLCVILVFDFLLLCTLPFAIIFLF